MTVVEIRFFAGAAEAAGRASIRLDAPTGASVAGLLGAAAAGNERLARTLPVCSVLLDGAAHRDLDAPLPPGEHTIDVLPPFAGG